LAETSNAVAGWSLGAEESDKKALKPVAASDARF
jgi:hypothetical protein